MKKYNVTDDDVVSINKLLDVGGENASITRDESEYSPFECGILSDEGYTPRAYGGGKAIADAIGEALGIVFRGFSNVSKEMVSRAMEWLAKHDIENVSRE